MIETIFPSCEKLFSEILLKETGKEMESKLTISEYKLEEQHLKLVGGIFLRSNDGNILCDNSLDSRVRLIFEQLLPTIRGELFPKN